MPDKKNRISEYFDEITPVYLMPGSSPFHDFEGLDQLFYFNFKINNNNLTVEFFFEYQCPKYADLMINFTSKLKKNIHFYKDEAFVEKMMVEIYNLSLFSFQTVCSQNNVALPNDIVKPNDEFTLTIINQMKQEAPALIKEWDTMKPFMDGSVFELPAASNRDILLKVTMLILDEIFMKCQSTDRMHNRKILEKNTGMSFSEFLMVRRLCNKETPGKIGFSPIESIRLFQLQDCAAQVLTGKIYDKIAKDMEYQGWNKDFQTQYLKELERFNKQCRAMLKKYVGRQFPSMVPFHDWDKELR